MAVSIDKVREEFIGDGVTVAFNTTLLATAANQIRVWDFDETVSPVTVTELLPGIGYTAVLNTPLVLPSTLTVDVTLTHSTGLPVDHTLIVVRQNDLLQDETFAPGDRWPDSAVELILDKAVLQAQYAKWLAGRALRIPIEDPDGQDLEIPSIVDRAGKIATYGPAGEPSAASLATLSPAVVLSALAQTLLVSNSAAVWRATLLAVERSGFWLKCGADTAAAKPTTVAFGSGVYFETDTRRLWFSAGGGAWIEITLGQFANASIPAAGNVGRLIIDTDQKQVKRDNGASFDLLRSLPPNYLSGGSITYVSGTSLTVAAAWAREAADAFNIRLASSMNKTLNAAGSLTAGAGGNACPTGALFAVNTWYTVFLISKPDGTTDWGVDLATVPTATNLLAAASGYTGYHRLGYIRSNAVPNLVPWIQDGDEFFWVTPQVGYEDAGDDDYTTAKLRTLAYAPPNCMVHGALGWTLFGGNAELLAAHVGQTLGAVNTNAAPGAFFRDQGITEDAMQFRLMTDANRQVQIRGSVETTSRIYIYVHGWRDHRGRES